MITIYVDPNDGDQVMAYYRDCKPGNPALWTDQGFTEVTVVDEHPLYRDLVRNQRDCQFDGVICTPRVNPVQPPAIPRNRLDDLRDRLANDSISDVEIREMLRLERGL